MELRGVILSALIISVLLVVSGVDECSQGGSFGGIGGKTEAAKFGVDFAVQTGIDKLSEGKIISQGSTFIVDVLLENFDSEPKSGQICIRDEIEDSYGGIPSICKAFNIPAATYIGDTIESPATIDIIFPDSGYYKYEGIPLDTDSKAHISISYGQSTTYSSAIKVPLPEQENIIFIQKPSPVKLAAEKTMSNIDNSAKLNLKFTISKQGNYNITSRDFKREAIGFSSNFGNYLLDCPEINQGFIDFKSTKFISCSALLPREQISHPLLVYLDYGVKLSRDFSFKIVKGV